MQLLWCLLDYELLPRLKFGFHLNFWSYLKRITWLHLFRSLRFSKAWLLTFIFIRLLGLFKFIDTYLLVASSSATYKHIAHERAIPSTCLRIFSHLYSTNNAENSSLPLFLKHFSLSGSSLWLHAPSTLALIWDKTQDQDRSQKISPRI